MITSCCADSMTLQHARRSRQTHRGVAGGCEEASWISHITIKELLGVIQQKKVTTGLFVTISFFAKSIRSNIIFRVFVLTLKQQYITTIQT